jgi:large subunit ribosomal protein L17
MRHRNKLKKLGRTASHRKAMLKNMASSLIVHQKIRTTLPKARALQSHIEKLITYGKSDTVHSRRMAFRVLQNRTLVKMLFDEIAPEYKERQGGYTRIIKLGRRSGDGAELAYLQLIGFSEQILDDGPKSSKRKSRKKTSAAAPVAAPVEETSEEEVVEAASDETAAAEETVEEIAEETEAVAEEATEAAVEEAEAAAEEATEADTKTEETAADKSDKGSGAKSKKKTDK